MNRIWNSNEQLILENSRKMMETAKKYEKENNIIISKGKITNQSNQFIYKDNLNKYSENRLQDEKFSPIVDKSIAHESVESLSELFIDASKETPNSDLQLKNTVLTANLIEKLDDTVNLTKKEIDTVETDLIEKTIKLNDDDYNKSYENLFEKYLKGVSKIIISEPYICANHQFKNLNDFISLLLRLKTKDNLKFHLITSIPKDSSSEYSLEEQNDRLKKIQKGLADSEIKLTWENINNTHARYILSDTDWSIESDRGLDIFKPPEEAIYRSVCHDKQELRKCKLTVIHFRHLTQQQKMQLSNQFI